PRLGGGDPLRLAVLDRAIVPPRARQVGGEPGAEAAAQRLVSGREGEVHDARSHSARRHVRPASEEPAEAVAQVPDAVLVLAEAGVDRVDERIGDERVAGARRVDAVEAEDARSRWNASSTVLRRSRIAPVNQLPL